MPSLSEKGMRATTRMPARSPLHRGGPVERRHRRLDGGVGAELERVGAQERAGREVEDHAAAVGQVRVGGPHEPHHGERPDPEAEVERLVGHLEQRPVRGDVGVVHQDVDAAERARRSRRRSARRPRASPRCRRWWWRCRPGPRSRRRPARPSPRSGPTRPPARPRPPAPARCPDRRPCPRR